jgi:hypothetical protein
MEIGSFQKPTIYYKVLNGTQDNADGDQGIYQNGEIIFNSNANNVSGALIREDILPRLSQDN